METAGGARLNLAQIHIIKLQTERQNRSTGEDNAEAKAKLAAKKRERIEIEADQVEAALDAALSKNPMMSTLGALVMGVADLVGDVKDAVEDAVGFVSPAGAAVIGVAFGGHLVSAASTLAAALPTIAGEGARWGLTTLSVTKVVDATVNVANLHKGGRAHELQEQLDAIDAQLLELESQVGRSTENRAENDADRRRTKQQLRQTLEQQSQVVDAHLAAMRGTQSSRMMSAQVPAGVRAAQVAQATAAELEANAAVAGIGELQDQIEQLREQALALRQSASDEQWKNEKTRAWLDFGAAWLEVAATVVTLGASSAGTTAVSAGTSGVAVAKSALSVGSAGLGIAGAFITDEGVQAKYRDAEAMEIKAEELQHSVDFAKAISTELRYEADQRMDRAVDSMELPPGEVQASAKGGAAVLKAQNGMTQMRKASVRDSNQRRFQAAGRSVQMQRKANARRVEADGAAGGKATWGQIGAIASGATAVAGLGFSIGQLDASMVGDSIDTVNAATELEGAARDSVNALQSAEQIAGAVGGVVQSGVSVRQATVDDGAAERREAERAKLQADRHQRDAGEEQQRLEKARREHRRSYDGQVAMARHLGGGYA